MSFPSITVFVNSSILSGAEIVLGDYITNSTFRFSLLISGTQEIVTYYKNMPHVDKVDIVPGTNKQYKIGVLSKIRNLWVCYLQARYIAEYCNNNKPNLLYANNVMAGIVLGIAKKFFGIETNVVCHVHDMMSEISCLRCLFFSYFCRNLSIITVSKKCKQEIVNCCWTNPENIAVAYNGIESHTIINYNKITNPCIVGFAGGIIARKGLMYLAQAVKDLNQEGYNIFLKIAYHIQNDSYWQKLEPLLKDVNYIKEKLSRKDMELFYRDIDILVVPSIRDPLPTVVLEAMSYGRIVIGSQVDGIPEMLDSNCLFLPHDSNSIKKCLKMILHMKSQELSAIQNRNKATIHNKFSIQRCSQHKDSIIQRLLNE